MAFQEMAVAVPSKTPYQLNLDQTTKACKVLLRHISEARAKRDGASAKPNLLGNGDDEETNEAAGDEDPVWLIMTTKKHISDQQRLKPSKITLPHPLNTTPTRTICLITASPQRTYKDLIQHASFPAALRARITRVIDVAKLKTKYKQFEARRQLLAEHDLFLADDRIVLLLPKLLGKVFYKTGAKRPVPVSVAASTRKRDANGRTVKKTLEERSSRKSGTASAASAAATPVQVAREIEKALGAALVHLAPGTSTAVKIGRGTFSPQQVAQNVDAVVSGLTERFVTQGWRNVRAVHVKGANTMAFPVWEANELWVDEGDVLEEKKKLYGNTKKVKTSKTTTASPKDGEAVAVPPGAGIKRKAGETTKVTADGHSKKKRKAEVDVRMAEETALRKERLKKQKAEALAEVGTGVF